MLGPVVRLPGGHVILRLHQTPPRTLLHIDIDQAFSHTDMLHRGACLSPRKRATLPRPAMSSFEWTSLCGWP